MFYTFFLFIYGLSPGIEPCSPVAQTGALPNELKTTEKISNLKVRKCEIENSLLFKFSFRFGIKRLFAYFQIITFTNFNCGRQENRTLAAITQNALAGRCYKPTLACLPYKCGLVCVV
jgi:hypothetical protein